MDIKHPVNIKNNQVKFFDRQRFNEDLKCFEGQDVYLSITKGKRSILQNNYYHGVVVKILAQELGHAPTEMHDILRLEFLKIGERKIGDKTFIIARSTTELTTSEFNEYVDQIRLWSNRDLNIYIPEPNEYGLEDSRRRD